MPNRNQCEIMGHLGRDPETRLTNNGQSVTSFPIATSNDYKDRSGEWQKKPATWWNCQAWGELGELVVQSFFKGDSIMVRGKGGLHTYQGKDGTEKSNLELRVFEVYKPIYQKKSGDAQHERREKPEDYGSSIREDRDFPEEVLKSGRESDVDIPF